MKTVTQKTYTLISRLASLGGHVFILIAAIALLAGGIYVARAQSTGSSGSGSSSYHSKEAIAYCQDITPNLKNLACQDGWDGTENCETYRGFTIDLNDPTLVPDDVVGMCVTAGKDKTRCTNIANKQASEPAIRKCPTITTTKEEEDDLKDSTIDELQKQLDERCAKLEEDGTLEQLDETSSIKKTCENQSGKETSSSSTEKEIEQLKKDVEDLKKAAEPPLADNQYGKYVNGANQYQEIRVNRASGDNRPAVVFINGGGWVADDGTGDKFAPHANERGYTTFVATYRLMSGGIYKQLDDVMRAMQHIRNNAGMYGIDPNRIAIAGDSAGGSLAVRAASTGKSGAKVQVGWSSPTNAYTAIFHSLRAFAAGMNHSTCAPTDLAGVNNVLNELNGGSSSSSSSSSNSSSSTTDDVSAQVQQILDVADQAVEISTTAEEISEKISTEEGQEELSGNARRLAAKKFLECIDNFNTASPALFARPGSPPGFFAGFETDPLVHPGQLVQMRDKLRALGSEGEVMILPGVPGDVVPGKNHLDYSEEFVPATLDFIDKYLHPEKDNGAAAAAPAPAPAPSPQASASTGNSQGSSNNGQGSGSNNNSSGQSGNNNGSQAPAAETPKSNEGLCKANGQAYDSSKNVCIPNYVVVQRQAKNCKSPGVYVSDAKSSSGGSLGSGEDRVVLCRYPEGAEPIK